MSELFEVDIEAFMGHIEAMKSYVDDTINKIQTRRLTIYDLLEDLEILANKAYALETIISLIKRKAQRFRPNNMDLYQAITDVEKDVKSLRSDIWMIIQAYKKEPNFDINNIYNDLLDIGARTNMIRLKMNTFIEDGLFA
jgi:archaellum component FlaC